MAANDVLAKLAVQITADVAKFGPAINQAQGQLKQLSSGVSAANKLLSAFGIGFSVNAVIQGIRGVVGIMSEFESTMSEVRAITGATGAEFEELKKSAIDLGASTKFSATEVGQLQIALGRLGFSTKEILSATEATLSLAAATGEDLAKAADTAGSTVRGFGLDAKETQRVVDVMAKSFNTTALGLDNFTESMKYVAPIAAAANVSVEETTALLGVLADAGIRGSSAGTALRKIFGDLSKDGRPVQERLAELGKKGLTLSDAFDEVGRTAQTALIVLSKNTEKADELTASFQNVTGEAEKMARVMQDNLAGDVEKLSSSWEGLILTFSKSDILRRVTQDITAFLDTLRGSTNADQAFRNLAEAFKFERSAEDIARLTEEVKKARIEAGKPFDASAIAIEFGEKYGLAAKDVNKFYQAILSVNDAMGFQEKATKQFTDFVSRNDYKDLATAADDYKSKLYQLIVTEQTRKQQLEETAKIPGGEDVFKKSIEAADGQILAYRRVIDIINQYVEANTILKKSNQDVVDPVVISLKYYRDIIKGLNDDLEKTKVTDQSRLRVLAAQISGYEQAAKRIEGLRDAIKSMDDLVFKMPDVSQLLDPINKITRSEGGLVFDVDIKLSDQVLERFKKRMKEIADAAKNTSTDLKASFEGVDLSGLLSSALSGVGEAFGEALSGTQSFGKALLGVLGGVLKQFGTMLVSVGVGIIALKKAFKSLNGYVAIAAGIALIALGAWASSATKGLGSAGGGGSTSGPQSTGNVERVQNQQTGKEIAFNAKFVIHGRDLVALAKNEDNRSGRLGG